MLIRPMEPRDYVRATAIRNSTEPEPVTVEVFAEWCTLDPQRNIHYHHLVAEVESGLVVGTAIACHNEWLPEGHWYIKVVVDPAHAGLGVGSRLHDEVERLARSAGATLVVSDSRGDERSRRWAERKGYLCTRERTESVMSLDEWDPTPFEGAIQRAEAESIRFTALSEVTGEEMLRRLYDFESQTIPDWPGFEPPFAPYEKWVKGFTGDERDRTPKIFVFAQVGESIVGSCVVTLPRGEGAGARIGFTGVRREYRGRGLALALKVIATEQTRRAGVTHIRTNNDKDNPAILALNAKLGYRLIPGPLRLKKQLDTQVVRD
ncbi:MAG: GNAT family N-acetyltransferase [Bacillota bacterium]